MAKSKIKPTQHTLEECRRQGWTAQVVEYWQPNFAGTAVIKAAELCVKTGVTSYGLREALARYKRGGPGIRKDLFGCIDVVAVTADCIVGIQATTTSNQSNRRTKIIEECGEAAEAWIRSGNRLVVWGWAKYEKAVNRRFIRHTETELTLNDFVVGSPF